MQKYKEVPWWWYTIVLALSFIAGKEYFFQQEIISENIHVCTGLIVVIKGQTTLPWWSYIIALMIGTFITVCVSPLHHLPLIYVKL